MKVSYQGTADFVEFSSADFTRAGLESAKKASFSRDVPKEVDDEVGSLLISDDGPFQPYNFVEVEEDEEETKTQPKKTADESSITASGSKAESTATPSGSTSTSTPAPRA